MTFSAEHIHLQFNSLQETETFGNQIAPIFWQLATTQHPLVIYLIGDLGSGKTTFVRAFLRSLGYSDKVKSPTYSLVEIYDLYPGLLYHLDLYRFTVAVSLETLGIFDHWNDINIMFIEWPKKAIVDLPPAQVTIHINTQPPQFASHRQTITDSQRWFTIQAEEPLWQHLLPQLKRFGHQE